MMFLTFGVLLCSNLTSGNCTPLPESLQNKRKRKKEGIQPRTLGHFLSVLLSYFISFYCDVFIFYSTLLFCQLTTWLWASWFFFYVEEHLNLCDFQNKTWSLKAQRKWKWKAEPSECVEFSPEKALLYANLSPVPSLYSATCPLLQY